MSYYVRRMRPEDVRQVAEIDRQAFPTMVPSANFQRELQNQLAHYIVVCDTDKIMAVPETKIAPANGWLKVVNKVQQLFNQGYFLSTPLSPNGREYVVGFVGMWMLTDEVHITNIAVSDSYKRQGIGELLLISIIELATELKARLITLEVRVSNTIAQNLYRKYGFTNVGIRRGYYSDNYEDGLLMSTENITSPAFQPHFRQRREAHFKKWGMASYHLATLSPQSLAISK